MTFIDTADIYGAGHNEVLVGRAISGRRGGVQLATKFGIDRSGGDDTRVVRGERGYVKRACESSLLRLGVDVIDLYYLHRPPQTAEIEETVGAMAGLVAQGKVRYLGLSAAVQWPYKHAKVPVGETAGLAGWRWVLHHVRRPGCCTAPPAGLLPLILARAAQRQLSTS